MLLRTEHVHLEHMHSHHAPVDNSVYTPSLKDPRNLPGPALVLSKATRVRLFRNSPRGVGRYSPCSSNYQRLAGWRRNHITALAAEAFAPDPLLAHLGLGGAR